jgi:rubrerythrin
MTREEAIRYLLNILPFVGINIKEALKMAIKALKQEPKTGHWIEKYTEDGCGELYSYWVCSECGISTDTPDDIKYVIGLLNKLPPVNSQPCGDAISRQATIEAFQMFRGYESNRTNAEWVDRIETVVEKLPPVKPQEKTGHWIEKYTEDGCGELYSYWACSECGRSVGFNLANIEDVLSDYPYCHCGAKMEGENK